MARKEWLIAVALPFQGLEFTGCIYFPVSIVKADIQRDYSDGVAGDQELIPFHVVERESENTAEFLQEIRSPLTIEG